MREKLGSCLKLTFSEYVLVYSCRKDSMVMVYAFPFSATCFKTSPTSTHLTLPQVLGCRGIIKYDDGLKLVQASLASLISPRECAAIGSITEILAPLHARKFVELFVLTLCILRCSIMRT
jgi:hypothetical protein